jgi:hypothetical protein
MILKGLVRDPGYRHVVFSEKSPERVFARTLLQIWLTYETRSIRYGIL